MGGFARLLMWLMSGRWRHRRSGNMPNHVVILAEGVGGGLFVGRAVYCPVVLTAASGTEASGRAAFGAGVITTTLRAHNFAAPTVSLTDSGGAPACVASMFSDWCNGGRLGVGEERVADFGTHSREMVFGYIDFNGALEIEFPVFHDALDCSRGATGCDQRVEIIVVQELRHPGDFQSDEFLEGGVQV